MAAKTIVITGASDGIGVAAARELVRRGNEVVVVGRNPAKTERVARDLGVDHFVADFSDLSAVRGLADDLLERCPRIDVLANNAGGIFSAGRQVTVDGHELTFQVNYLAPFLLTDLLMDRLVASGGTVVNTSSVANKLFGRVDIDDLDAERHFRATKAYGDSKLEQILFTKELDRRYRHQGVTSTAFHPGTISTGFSNDKTSPMYLVYHTPLRHVFLTTPEKGADTLVYLADNTPGRDYPTGEYYVKRKVAVPNAQAEDADLARELWDRTVAMLHAA
ncbi:SDR family NAD(P)-dependent oxidoreductase [Curtobacterium sp. MWU13-2055]|uniref:SDR family NAD(P)-dependent oxidoreductase n=1 Tax=Curtobacterium sp. MWU13-2055 TaxID=2931928 RepID=UPI00200F87B0|nr:SDR family NAD(P)-dependent oxidoreductase [Curtobacterium sp. MWU13-2055]